MFDQSTPPDVYARVSVRDAQGKVCHANCCLMLKYTLATKYCLITIMSIVHHLSTI